MKKSLLILSMIMVSTNIVLAEGAIAVVDLQQLVNSSSQVKLLKQEHAKKIKELDKIIVNARGEISNEKDPAKVLLLEDKYINRTGKIIIGILLFPFWIMYVEWYFIMFIIAAPLHLFLYIFREKGDK